MAERIIKKLNSTRGWFSKRFVDFTKDEAGAVTIEWVVLTAGVIALAIAAYSAFKIDTDNTYAVLVVTQNGSTPHMGGGNAISQLIARTKLESMIFISCIFETAQVQEDALGNKFDICS